MDAIPLVLVKIQITMRRYLSTGFFLIGAISMLVMSLHYFQYEITGILKGKAIANTDWYRLCLKVHIIGGIVAIAVGPFQFIKAFRLRFKQVHRRIGYIYFVSIVLSSLTGLVVAQFAIGGRVSTIGFSTLAIFWLVTVVMAFQAILNGDLQGHKKWMYISYGLTFSAITQRTMLAMALFPGISFIVVYKLSAWLPWIFNAGVAFYLFQRSLPVNSTASQ